MLKKLLLCVVMIFVLGLVACGGKEDENKSSESSTPKVENQSGNNNTEATTTTPEASTDAGKNEVGSDKNVTDGTTTKNLENTYNVGGIEFEIPDTFKKKDVFVGAELVFESTKNQGMLSMRYHVIDEIMEGAPDVEGFASPKEFFIDYIMKVLNSNEYDEQQQSSFYNEFSELTDFSKESLSVAGYKAVKYSAKGKKQGDCYREGPVKNLVNAAMASYVIYNDVDENYLTITYLCKEGKAESMDQLVSNMLANATVADSKDNMQGKYGESYIELGGFSFEIPESYGSLYDHRYFSEAENYTYYYSTRDENNIWWTNINAQRIVLTKAEFEEESGEIVNEMFESLGTFYSDIEITSSKNYEIDGMQAIRYDVKGLYEGVPTDCRILLVNNTKTRFCMFIYSFFNEEDQERADAFDSLIGSMKLLK